MKEGARQYILKTNCVIVNYIGIWKYVKWNNHLYTSIMCDYVHLGRIRLAASVQKDGERERERVRKLVENGILVHRNNDEININSINLYIKLSFQFIAYPFRSISSQMCVYVCALHTHTQFEINVAYHTSISLCSW